jgi:Fic family protein
MPYTPALISASYLDAYTAKCDLNWRSIRGRLRTRSVYTALDFEYYVIASSLFSSKIEGNTLDLNSFMNNKGKRSFAVRKEYKEIQDLAGAYSFAAGSELTQANFLHVHKLLSATLLSKPRERGAYRRDQIGVFDNSTGRPVYLAVEPEHVATETARLFADIEVLCAAKLTSKEVFYYASMIHAWVAMIHPFTDGNGRMARLTEKWFLAAKLGEAAWSLNTEKYYWDNRAAYYRNISLGYNYYALKWERCVPFLLMLPEALRSIM